ncbi:MAG: ABC transporter substrate-binding protein [Pirellulales bacterium]
MAGHQRIVSLISSATEILFLLELGERVVGVSHECDFPPAVAALPRLTRARIVASASSRAIDQQVRELSATSAALYEIDVDRLAALKPDLIITQAQCDVCAVRYEDVVSAVQATPALAVAEILALNPHSLSEVLDDIERVARAVRDDAVARRGAALKAEKVEFLAQRQCQAAAIPSGEVPRVICLEWIDPPMVAANWTPELVAWSGGQPGLSRAGAHSTYADWQQIVDYDPQVLVIMPCGFDLDRAIDEAQVLSRFAGWHALSAVRCGRVYAVDGNAYFNRSGPRLIDSLEILGQLVQPRYFPRPIDERAARAWRRMDTRGAALVAV